MNYIDSFFHYYETTEAFETHRDQGLINPDSICFIKETGQIYTQNYLTGINVVQYNNKVKELEDFRKTTLEALGFSKDTSEDGTINTLLEVLKFTEGFSDDESLRVIIDGLNSAIGVNSKNLKKHISDYDKHLADFSEHTNEFKSLQSTVRSFIPWVQMTFNGNETRFETVEKFAQDIVDSIGQANGIAPLEHDGRISSRYLPVYIDEVYEYPTREEFPEEGLSSKIYIALDSNVTYRWSGSTYVEIGKSVVLGYSNNTAFPGDEGAQNTSDIEELKICTDRIEAEVEFLQDSKADVDDLSNVAAEEVLETPLLEEIETLTREEIKKDLFIDMWNSACGTNGRYNPETKLFELNGITDISYKEALSIYQYSAGWTTGTLDNNEQKRVNIRLFQKIKDVRTLIPCQQNHTWVNLNGMYSDSDLEVIMILSKATVIPVMTPYQAFYNCKKLKKVLNTIEYFSDYRTFYNCLALEDIRLQLSGSVNLQHSPLLNYDSFNYMIRNRANNNTKEITITVHPDVYAKLTDETNTEWNNLLTLAASKNISFASA